MLYVSNLSFNSVNFYVNLVVKCINFIKHWLLTRYYVHVVGYILCYSFIGSYSWYLRSQENKIVLHRWRECFTRNLWLINACQTDATDPHSKTDAFPILENLCFNLNRSNRNYILDVFSRLYNVAVVGVFLTFLFI